MQNSPADFSVPGPDFCFARTLELRSRTLQYWVSNTQSSALASIKAGVTCPSQTSRRQAASPPKFSLHLRQVPVPNKIHSAGIPAWGHSKLPRGVNYISAFCLGIQPDGGLPQIPAMIIIIPHA